MSISEIVFAATVKGGQGIIVQFNTKHPCIIHSVYLTIPLVSVEASHNL